LENGNEALAAGRFAGSISGMLDVTRRYVFVGNADDGSAQVAIYTALIQRCIETTHGLYVRLFLGRVFRCAGRTAVSHRKRETKNASHERTHP
jgi:hypothetical protein